jgi:DNA helicase-2/ATP-dependent DNA helicase PcrA
MQDYSLVQYRILSLLYPCKKTILGDVNQSVNPFSSSNLPIIEKVFSDATTMTMLKSYRSTYEITQFTKNISQTVEVEAVERHGQEPGILSCTNSNEEIKRIKSLVIDFEKSEFNSLGIICKTQKQADELYRILISDFKLIILNAASVAFGSGIVITTAHLAKGLEFDQVIVPHSDKSNYKSETDRQMLYVACTRAMHKLTLTYTGNLTGFILNLKSDYF